MGYFLKGQVYDWGWSQNTGAHTHTKIIGSYTPPTPRQRPLPQKRFIPFKIFLKVKFSIIKRIKGYLLLREKDKNLLNENR